MTTFLLSVMFLLVLTFFHLWQIYGDIEYAIIIKNKSTGESKGLGYVRYHKPSQAAKAIENCDKSKWHNWTSNHGEKFESFLCVITSVSVCLAFRAILAEPRTKNASADNDYFSNQRSDHAGNEPGLSTYPFGSCYILQYCSFLVIHSWRVTYL